MERFSTLFPLLAALMIAACFLASFAQAETLEDLHPNQKYYVERIEIEGNQAIPTGDLKDQIQTKQRPGYLIWKQRPAFDSDVFASDIRHLRRYYRAKGYYSAKVSYDLRVQGDLVTASIRIHEGQPVKVDSVKIILDGHPLPPAEALYEKVGLKAGDVLSEEAYQAGQARAMTYLRDNGYAYAKVERRAIVNISEHAARVEYLCSRGIKALFGATRIKGADAVAPYIISRALAYKRGEPFSQAKLDASRKQILDLGLFSAVSLSPKLDDTKGREVPIVVAVREKPKHSIMVAGGYNTESQFIANFQWSDLNWVGGGRQLSVLFGYSNITSTISANFKQPFLFGSAKTTGLIKFGENVQQVPPFTLFETQLEPRIQYQMTQPLMLYAGYRLQYDKMTAIDGQVIDALGSIRQSGILLGPVAGLAFNSTDDPLYPTRGYVLTVDGLQGGGVFGGKYDFYQLTAEAKHYQLVWLNTVVATRLKIGLADSLGSKQGYPLFERFYAGGEGSVRGYGYWMLGPLTADHTPLGGLSLITGSFELRHHIWKSIYGAAFLDFGQLSLKPYDLPVDNLQLSAGPAVSYVTPIGPLRIDLGIPFHKPPGQQSWQVYFSVGQYF